MVIAFAGRRIDALDSEEVRFPLSQVPLIRQRIENKLINLNCNTLICSGACGSDLIALSVARSLDIKRELLLPYSVEIFRRESVTDRPGNWGELFDQIVQELTLNKSITILNFDERDPQTYFKTNEKLVEKAIIISKKQSINYLHNTIGLIVWEGRSYGTNDTTNNFKKVAINQGLIIEEILTI
ncbi:hypothetical protein [Rudanella paleaurantiibacter]|nr:hypothetical protein [Rudanella paleaurantiibacter]